MEIAQNQYPEVLLRLMERQNMSFCLFDRNDHFLELSPRKKARGDDQHLFAGRKKLLTMDERNPT